MYKKVSGECWKAPGQGEVDSIMSRAEAAFAERELDGGLIDAQEFNNDWAILGGPAYRVWDDGLAYSIGALVSAFDPYNRGQISQTKFYKLLYLLSADLESKGIDIKLPYFWYRHGPVVPYSFLPEGIIELRPMNWSKHQGKWIVLRNRQYPKAAANKKEIIDDAVAVLLERYSNARTIKIVSDVYVTAPHEFQRNYKEFIKHLDNKIKYRDVICSIQDLKAKEDMARLEKAIDYFDESKFSQIYDELLQWRLLTKYSVSHLDTIDINFISGISNIYWDKLFCAYLKVREYQNLPDSLITKWKSDLPVHHDEYVRSFRALEEYFYSSVYKPASDINANSRDAYCDCVRSLFR